MALHYPERHDHPERRRGLQRPRLQGQNVGNGLCIGFTGFFASANARLIQTTCDEGIEWRLNPQNDNGTSPLVDLSPILSDSICMAAGDLSDNNQTPLMSRFCDGFQDAAQILELG
jgi:hypothetical protein